MWPVPIGGSAGGLRSVELNSTAEQYASVWCKGHAGMVDAVERPVWWSEACCRFDRSGRGWGISVDYFMQTCRDVAVFSI